MVFFGNLKNLHGIKSIQLTHTWVLAQIEEDIYLYHVRYWVEMQSEFTSQYYTNIQHRSSKHKKNPSLFLRCTWRVLFNDALLINISLRWIPIILSTSKYIIPICLYRLLSITSPRHQIFCFCSMTPLNVQIYPLICHRALPWIHSLMLCAKQRGIRSHLQSLVGLTRGLNSQPSKLRLGGCWGGFTFKKSLQNIF